MDDRHCSYKGLNDSLPSSQGSPILDELLHSDLRCGQSTTSSFCQASLPRCASTQSQLVWASGICCCRPNCLELTEWWFAWSDASTKYCTVSQKNAPTL